MRRFAFVFLFLVSCGGSAGQAGGATAPKSTETPPPAPPNDGDMSGKKKAEGAGASTMVDLPSAERALDDASKAFAAAGSDCVSMCKALQSMARATERLCELAGNGPDATRCADAKSKLEGARAKVKATCGGACE
ncbi:MAG: hypothetical protein ACXVEF_06990 [Polyangiales bacterium]